MLYLSKIKTAVENIKNAKEHYNSSFMFTLFRVLKFHNKANFSLEEIMFWGLTSPEIDGSSVKRYVATESRVRIEKRLNAPKSGYIVDDKAAFQQHCEEHDLIVPHQLFVLPPNVTGSEQLHFENYVNILRLHKGKKFLCKPTLGMKGKGITLAQVSMDGDTVTMNGNVYEFNSFLRELSLTCPNEPLLVQLMLSTSPQFLELTGSSSVQTLRLVSFLDRNEKFHLLFGNIKIIVGDNYITNFSKGTTGNLIAEINLSSGKIGKCFHKKVSKIGLETMTHHPDTGNVIEGFSIPYFNEAVSLVESAARTMPELKVLGWDVAITDTGPVLIEANQEWSTEPLSPITLPIPDDEWRNLIRPLRA